MAVLAVIIASLGLAKAWTFFYVNGIINETNEY
jgi:hypothetical protein